MRTVFLLPSVRNVVIPGDDPESSVRFDTLDSRFRENDTEGMDGLSPQCNSFIERTTYFPFLQAKLSDMNCYKVLHLRKAFAAK